MSSPESENSPETVTTRPIKGRFVAGAPSPNPGGRPRQVRELAVRCREMTDAILADLGAIIGNKRSRPADRISAARVLLSYGYGAAPISVEISGGEHPVGVAALRALSSEELRQRIEVVRSIAALPADALALPAAKSTEGET